MPPLSLAEAFSPLHDPRQSWKVEHQLLDIIVISLCGLLCGAQSYTDIADMGRERLSWFRETLGLALPNGIPSHDTLSKVFRMVDTGVFEECFFRWMSAAQKALKNGTVVNIDGKTVRGSHERSKDIDAIHLVSAFVGEHGLVLGQRATEEKSNEITAIPELVKMLSLKNCIVTIDAMGTQTAIIEALCEKEADYLVPVKENQPTLCQDVLAAFDKAESKQWREIKHTKHRTVNSGHGRIETRTCWAMKVPKQMAEQGDRWQNLTSIAMIEAICDINSVCSTERRYFISSLPPTADLILSVARGHWKIENKLHWSLDVQMREDECRVRGDGAQNLAVLRRIAFNQLQRDSSLKRSLRAKQLKACMNDEYLKYLFFLQ